MYLIFGLYLKSICKYTQIHIRNYQNKAKHWLTYSDLLTSQDRMFFTPMVGSIGSSENICHTWTFSCILLSSYECLLSAKNVAIDNVAFHVGLHSRRYALPHGVNPLSSSQAISKWWNYDLYIDGIT